jgi:hypothetical protein
MPQESIAGGAAQTAPHLRGTVRAVEALRPIVHLASLVELIKEMKP